MTARLDEVQTGVNSVVGELGSVDTVLLLEVGIESRLNIVDDWLPAVRCSGW